MTFQQFNDRVESLKQSPQCRLNADQLLSSASLARGILEAGFELERSKASIQRLPLSRPTRLLIEKNKPFDLLLASILHWIEHGIIIRQGAQRR